MNVSNVLKKNPKIIKLFNEHCPDLNLEYLEDDLIEDIVKSIRRRIFDDFSKKSIKKIVKTQDITIDDNYDMADKYIPEMLLPSNQIHLNGKINNIPVKLIFDTGAATNLIYRSKMIEVGLDNIVDKGCIVQITGVNSSKKSYGKIWYTEIALDLNDKEKEQSSTTTAIVVLNLTVIDDGITDKKLNLYDIILGTNFMKSYRANIDFMTNTITLNNTIKIKFN